MPELRKNGMSILSCYARYSLYDHLIINKKTPESLFIIVLFTTACWIITTFITKPVDKERLIEFYNRVQPGGSGWNRVKNMSGIEFGTESLLPLFWDWIIGILLIYASLFSIGKIILMEYLFGFILLAFSLLFFIILYFRLRRSVPDIVDQ